METELKLKCNDQLRHQIQERLQHFDYKEQKGNRLKRAAVAITIVGGYRSHRKDEVSSFAMTPNDAAFILTRRSSRLKHHAGQWALPGGRLDQGEAPEEAALRELQEEVHLQLEKDCILGRLDDFTTRSGFIMTPVVIWGGWVTQLTPNPAEVRSVHRVPVRELLRPDSPVLEKSSSDGNPILYMPVGSNWIAAPTAALLYQFREVVILGNPTRVAHYEQPLFAWH